MFMLLTDKYANRIYGTITCYDRMIIQGYISGWSHADGMIGYLNANNIHIFDLFYFPSASQMKIALKSSSSVSFWLSRRWTESMKSFGKLERPKGWSIFFPPWNNAVPINFGMTRYRVRHSSSWTRANVSTIIFTSLTKSLDFAIYVFPASISVRGGGGWIPRNTLKNDKRKRYIHFGGRTAFHDECGLQCARFFQLRQVKRYITTHTR